LLAFIKDKKLVASRKQNLKHRYGITEEEYNQMLIQQKHSCKICGHKPDKHQTQPDKYQTQPDKPLYVDHCHQTKVIRGLLCHKCNVALGHMNDDPQRLEKAISYLKESCIEKNYCKN
jgi:hypothetical protein